uniref:Small EDRK-rich factor-like N-terminal domain-containing protein n=1 Tax=Mycena chlorophos TaxID=658473 RepID=A0ABQ0KY10_MYCCL|nr:predicted protein [Mycena chlorophos]
MVAGNKGKQPKRFLDQTAALGLAESIAEVQEQKAQKKVEKHSQISASPPNRTRQISESKTKLKQTKALLALRVSEVKKARKKQEGFVCLIFFLGSSVLAPSLQLCSRLYSFDAHCASLGSASGKKCIIRSASFTEPSVEIMPVSGYNAPWIPKFSGVRPSRAHTHRSNPFRLCFMVMRSAQEYILCLSSISKATRLPRESHPLRLAVISSIQ